MTEHIRAGIAAAASYVPPLRVTNETLAQLVDTSDEWISSRSGIKVRHISAGENTSEMCVKAANKLLEKSGADPESVGLIIVATVTPDYAFPSTACLVQAAIGAENAMAFDLSAACTGFVYAMSVADKYLRAGGLECAMVIGAETMSKIVDWSDRSTCVLFADGCGAALLVPRETGVLCEAMGADGSMGMSLTGGYAPAVNPFADKTARGPGGAFIKMDGRAIFDFSLRTVRDNIESLMAKSGVSKDDVRWWVLHQANIRIVDALAKKLEVPRERFYTNMNEYGNTSAASIPIVLDEMSEAGLIRFGSGEKAVLCGFGGGLTYGSILLEL